jgi:hypothetical protein
MTASAGVDAGLRPVEAAVLREVDRTFARRSWRQSQVAAQPGVGRAMRAARVLLDFDGPVVLVGRRVVRIA